MSKRQAKSIEEVHAWLRRGDGQGEGVAYKPFFHVRDVPSLGRSAIDLGIKTGLSHHYMSDIEYGYSLLAQYSESVEFIRDQYALTPQEETLEIAHSLGISHPVYSSSQIPRVLTSDLVLTMKHTILPRYTVISCKSSADLDLTNPKSGRTWEKLHLEKVYWSRRSVRWILGTDDSLPKIKIFNLDFFRSTMQSRERDWLNPLLPEFVRIFKKAWTSTRSLNEILRRLSRWLHIETVEAFTLLGRAVWLHQIPIDLNTVKLSHEDPIPLLAQLVSA